MSQHSWALSLPRYERRLDRIEVCERQWGCTARGDAASFTCEESRPQANPCACPDLRIQGIRKKSQWKLRWCPDSLAGVESEPLQDFSR